MIGKDIEKAELVLLRFAGYDAEDIKKIISLGKLGYSRADAIKILCLVKLEYGEFRHNVYGYVIPTFAELESPESIGSYCSIKNALKP